MLSRKIIFLVIGFFSLFSCTNPEVNFPEEKKDAPVDKKTVPYKIPTLLVYANDVSPVIFYHFISLARANGAEDSYLIPVAENKSKILKTIDKLFQFYGEKPALIGIKVSIKDYYEEIKPKVKKTILLAPQDQISESTDCLIFGAFPNQDAKQKNKENTGAQDANKSNNLSFTSIPKEIETARLQEILSKLPEEQKNFLLKMYQENVQTKKFILGPNNLTTQEEERIKQLLNPDSPIQANAVELIPKQFDSEKMNKEILPKLNEEDRKTLLAFYIEDIKEKKHILKDPLAEIDKSKLLTLLNPFLPKPQQAVAFSFPESMKDYNFLSSLLKKIVEGEISLSTAEDERLVYFKGKTFPKTKLILFKSDEDNKKRNKMNVVSNQDGLFSPLIVNSKIPFYIQVASSKREWFYFFQGLNHSFSFFEILPPDHAIAEVRSYFSPLDLKNFILPDTIKIPDEMIRLIPKLYYIKLIAGSKFEVKPSSEGLILTIPDDTPPIQIKTASGLQIDFKKNSSLIILD